MLQMRGAAKKIHRMCVLRDTWGTHDCSAEHGQTQLIGQTINARDMISTAWRLIHPKDDASHKHPMRETTA